MSPSPFKTAAAKFFRRGHRIFSGPCHEPPASKRGKRGFLLVPQRSAGRNGGVGWGNYRTSNGYTESLKLRMASRIAPGCAIRPGHCPTQNIVGYVRNSDIWLSRVSDYRAHASSTPRTRRQMLRTHVAISSSETAGIKVWKNSNAYGVKIACPMD